MQKISFKIVSIIFGFWALVINAQKPVSNINTYAVIVGISEYECISDLNLSAADAKAMSYLFDTLYNAKVKLLLDQEATTSNILNAIDSTFSYAKPNDLVFLFFSGHGYPGGFCNYEFNAPGCKYLTFDQIAHLFSKCKAKRKIIMADACHSGKFRNNNNKQEDSLLQDKIKKSQILLFLSSRGNELSWETPSMKNGFFTTYLLEAYYGKADLNKNGKLTAIELFKYVHPKVVNATMGRQHPVMWGNFNKGLIIHNFKAQVLPCDAQQPP